MFLKKIFLAEKKRWVNTKKNTHNTKPNQKNVQNEQEEESQEPRPKQESRQEQESGGSQNPWESVWISAGGLGRVEGFTAQSSRRSRERSAPRRRDGATFEAMFHS